MNKEKTTPTETETFVTEVIERFNSRLSDVLSEEREGLDPVRDHSQLTNLTNLQSYAEERKQFFTRQYEDNLVRLHNIRTGKRVEMTVGVYMQKWDIYKRIFENNLNHLLEEIQKRIMLATQRLRVA